MEYPSADYTHHEECSATIPAAPEDVFGRLDDPALLGAHMAKGSAMMLGGSMRYEFDLGAGRTVGSEIRVTGRFLGVDLLIREVVTDRSPPTRKVWETVGEQRLLVIDAYRMGFELRPAAVGTTLRVFIDYRLPAGRVGLFLGSLFGPVYARWCVRRMVADARSHFGQGAV